MLLDSALCAISPLLFLTSQIPEMNGCSPKTQVLGFFYFNQHLVSPDGDHENEGLDHHGTCIGRHLKVI